MLINSIVLTIVTATFVVDRYIKIIELTILPIRKESRAATTRTTTAVITAATTRTRTTTAATTRTTTAATTRTTTAATTRTRTRRPTTIRLPYVSRSVRI